MCVKSNLGVCVCVCVCARARRECVLVPLGVYKALCVF